MKQIFCFGDGKHGASIQLAGHVPFVAQSVFGFCQIPIVDRDISGIYSLCFGFDDFVAIDRKYSWSASAYGVLRFCGAAGRKKLLG